MNNTKNNELKEILNILIKYEEKYDEKLEILGFEWDNIYKEILNLDNIYKILRTKEKLIKKGKSCLILYLIPIVGSFIIGYGVLWAVLTIGATYIILGKDAIKYIKGDNYLNKLGLLKEEKREFLQQGKNKMQELEKIYDETVSKYNHYLKQFNEISDLIDKLETYQKIIDNLPEKSKVRYLKQCKEFINSLENNENEINHQKVKEAKPVI